MRMKSKQEYPDIEKLWSAEIAKRMAELDSGHVRAISWEEARKQIQSVLIRASVKHTNKN